ncbi:MAG: MoaD/ThiS family protein [Chloroflexi bacterium]|jgi:sulfur carrier protein ThiS|nr:MoaD/ThiS family protein [Chloroflexota bacterium]
MKVTVKLVGGFVHTMGFSQKDVDVAPGSTVGDVLAAVAIPPDRPRIVARNGQAAVLDEEVHEGDRILVSHVFSGG